MHLRIVFVFVTFFWSVRSQLEENFPIIYSTINETKKISRNVESNYSTSIIDRSNVTENQTDFKVNVSNNEETNKYKTKDFEIIGKYVSKNDSDHSTNNTKTFVLESRDNQRNWGPHEEDILEAVDFGLQAMHDLYNVKEPKLYSMGLYLGADNPAKYVAAFNDQTEEARMLAKFGYAVLEGATMFVKKFPDMSREFPLSRNGPTTRLQRQCPRRGTPRCPPASLRYRTSDGSCNNLKNPWWGSAMSTMQRFLPPNYDDGIQTIRRSKNGNPLPSPRVISDVLHEDRDIQLASITHMLMQWGQFVDHDLTDVSIHDEFRNSENLETAGSVDRLLLGLVNQPSQKRDEFITGELTRHLFQTPGFPFGMDLASLNIQRGRDHGIPPYVDWRGPCGLSPVKSFADLEKIMPSKSVIKFRTLYPNVEDIDLYSAGLAENSIRGGLVGPTFACIIAQQFSNLRRGDRFWYENEKEESGFTSRQLQQIRRITFSQVLCHTIDNIKTIQPFVFLVADTFRNQRVDCNDELMTQFSLEPWIERPPEQRSGSGNIKLSDRKRTDQIRSTTSKSFTSLKQEATKENVKINTREQTKTLPQGTKPFKANINQHNRIVVKKPFGPPDNVTIVVQNNAVNSPVFVNDAIYGSYIQIQTTTQSHKDIPRPEYFNYQTNAQYNPLLYDQGSFNIPIHKPPSKPIPTVIPDRSGSLQNIRPYIPYSYDDPNNPNPLNYGYRPNYTPEDIVYDDFSPTSPRPTLYTYYMHAQQFKTTQRPIHQNEGQSSYYNPSYNKLSTVQHYQEVSPSPWIKTKPQFESNSQSYAQRLSSDSITNPHPQYNSNMNNRPEYWPHQTSSAIKDEIIHSGQIYYNYNQDKSTDKSSNKDESSTWKYSTNVQKDNGFAISSSRPYNKPSVPQETDIHMNIPINRPYNEDDPDIYNKKPFHTSNLTMLNKSNDQNGLGNLPNVQVYQEEAIKNPILNNPSEWTNIPSYQQGPTKRPDSIILHEEPSYQKSPIKTPTIVQSDLNWTEVLSYQADLSKETSYQQRLTIKPDRSTSNSFYQTNPLKDSTNKSIEKTEDISYQRKPIPLVPIQELAKVSANNKSSRPTKIQSVTIVTESTETVQHSGSTGYRPENKINKEIPRPLELRQNDGKPGQYYYDKNVLHRYPEKIEDDISKNDHPLVKDDVIYNGTKEILAKNKTIVELNYTDVFTKAHVIQNDNDKFITTPTIVINDSESYIDDDLDGAFSENIESVTTLNDLQRTNYWLNSEENPGLSSILEMPNVTSDESISVKELPKPLIKTSKSAS
ncbi:uncharacterized protein LOC124951581 isoform X4 [Vespa velutina]|uniref:uncharacterized protein LOC124951581 isoform X4 n=1 Tax=Vespa velutina TaxID=202808 RepID=UPI001FB48666|nr:uncharacterized protein LOC124951581 isoform X4 [Vespa velutina]